MDYAAKCQLISLVEEEECIWNTNIDDYSRLDKKNASWNRIHAEMAQNGYSGGLLELKTHWKNLRDQWRKNTLTKSNANTRPWTFEKHLLFLETAQNEISRTESAVKRWLTTVFGDPKEEEMRNSARKRMSVSLKKELIQLVKAEEMLWNTECRDYFRPDKKNLAWSRILSKLQKMGFRGGMLELKASWKTLRDSKRRNSIQPNKGGTWMYEKDMEFMDLPMKNGSSVQFSPHEDDLKSGIVEDSPKSATPENEGTAEEGASAAASDEVNDDYFVPTEFGQDSALEEPSRKRSYTGGAVSTKKKKHDSLQEGLDMIREVTASLRERLSASTMDKYDRYGAFIASSLRDMSEPAAKRKMAELMDILLNNH
ncbi:unnamed protein product [Cylicocyclus nassatus]|uniref:MADF domain-containing protein n=1 Tax=Cylicocyclus nassatus TaxID=53992 RepID=A0AA36DVE3_CYLNA|nr:unnamed protein product [Cylicocyclus nassatus]